MSFGLTVCNNEEDFNNNKTYTIRVDELDRIKMDYIKDFHTIDYSYYSLSEDDYQKIYELVLQLDQNGKKCKVIININNRNLFNKLFLNTPLNNVRVFVHSDDIDYSLQIYKKEEKKLNSLLQEMDGLDLSPLETYLYIYNIVKKFKPYSLCENDYRDLRKSSALRYVLFNDYIVCTGFSHLLKVLCEKKGISVSEYSVRTNYLDKDGKEKIDGHRRCIVSIDDDKYNVHGLYMADPTWDSHEGYDMFNHALMTFDQMQVSKYRFYYTCDEPIIDIHDFKEYNEQVDYLMKREIYYDSLFFSSFVNNLNNAYENVLLKIIYSISSDPKYNYFNDRFMTCETEDDYINLLSDLGNYLLTRVNKKVDDAVLFEALYNIGLIREDENDEEVINDYYDLDLYFFPYRVDKKRDHHLIKRRV